VIHITWQETLERLASNVSPTEVVRWIHVITATLDALDQNANARLALEVMMLELPGVQVARAVVRLKTKSPSLWASGSG
jgi:hypothetical protein